MSQSAGTGYPNVLRCGKCKVLRDWRHDYNKGMNLRATGRRRTLLSCQRGRGNPRALQYRAEYECLACGHVGWSRHIDMQWLLARRETTS